MFSSFKVTDNWAGSPYDPGTAKYLQVVEAAKRTTDELKVLVEPVLYARRVEDGKVSNTIETLSVEPHIVHVSSESLTPQFLAREGKLREKRIQLKQQQLAENGGTSADLAALANREDQAEDRVLELPSSNKRKRGFEKTYSSKKLRGAPVPSPATPTLPVRPPASAATTTKLQTPPAAQQPARPTAAAPTPVLTPVIRPQIQQQLTVPAQSTSGDSVLVRLSSGQVVLVPKELLKKVQTPTQTTVNQPTLNRQLPDPPRPAPITVSLPNLPAGSPNVSSSSADHNLNQALDIVRRTMSKQHTPESLLSLQPLPRQQPQQQHQQLTQVQNGVNGDVNGLRVIKVRAFQGNSDASAPASMASLIVSSSPSIVTYSSVSSQPTSIVTTTTTTSTMGGPPRQLIKIQQLPQSMQNSIGVRPNNIVLHPLSGRTFVNQSGQPIAIRQIMPQARTMINPSSIAVRQLSSNTPIKIGGGAMPMAVTQLRHQNVTNLVMPTAANGMSVANGQPVRLVLQQPQKPDGSPGGYIILNTGRQGNIMDVLKTFTVQGTTSPSGGPTSIMIQQPQRLMAAVNGGSAVAGVTTSGGTVITSPKLVPSETGVS